MVPVSKSNMFVRETAGPLSTSTSLRFYIGLAYLEQKYPTPQSPSIFPLTNGVITSSL